MARLAGVLLAGLSLGCQTVAPARASRALEVQELSVEFLEPGSGRLTFVIPHPPPAVTAVQWNLELGGWRFAAGLEGSPRNTGAGLRVDTPLVWRHLRWKEGSRYLDVRVTGVVLRGAEAPPVPFSGGREVLVSGSPLPDAAED